MLYVKELEENVTIAKSDYIIIIYFKIQSWILFAQVIMKSSNTLIAAATTTHKKIKRDLV